MKIESTKTGIVDIESLLSTNNLLHESFVRTFAGVEIKEDKQLAGNDYYIAVSSALLAEIEKKRKSNY